MTCTTPLVTATLVLSACHHAGILVAPRGSGAPCPSGLAPAVALECHAPILMQETAPGVGGVWDQPTELDPDGSGALRDDAASATRGATSDTPLTLYTRAVADTSRLYLFYGLYYPADWSGPAEAPRLDHPGDFEGALVVVDARSGAVEAVVTQAHNLFYLWLPDAPGSLPDAASGAVTIEGGRAVLFAESGGHGLYAFGHGAWSPAGGTSYADGPAALPADHLRRLEPQDLRPLEELAPFTTGPLGGFRDLPGGAKPPWRWLDRRRTLPIARGAIVLAPDAFYRAIRRIHRP